MVNSEPVFLATRQGNYANYVASGVFFSDNRGGIFYVTFENPETKVPYDSPDAWKIYTVASLRVSGDDLTAGYSIPLGLATGGSSGTQYIGGGTANALRADPPKTDPPDEDNQHLLNKSQMIFAFAMPDIAAEGGKKSERDDWAQLSADDAAGSNPAEFNGWYIPLREADTSYFEEYVTTRPVLSGGKLYVATFMQEKIDHNSSGICETGGSFMGKSRLYAISLENGGAALWSDGGDGKKKYLEFDGVKIVSATEGDDIIFGIEELAPTEEGKSREYNQNGVSVSYKENFALILDAGPSGDGSTGDGYGSPDDGPSDGKFPGGVTPNDSIINYWLYK